MDGDADGDFDVDAFDFLAWQQQYGIGAGPLSAVSAVVPEPSSIFLLLFGLGMVVNSFQRGRL
ncbi:MAG: PEP-CTERM sorting domain-containing protein, partial [Planctomycetales bacterium]|nr:PEP-CTERM sorting domain-containing protein [Planctomycetales bacterium]